ncbi:MAG: hypothetical protein EHM42_13870, partial [Planctomycetaceae bacterium]
MSGQFTATRKLLLLSSLTLGLTWGPATDASAQSVRNPFSRSTSSSRSARPSGEDSSEINRELADIYRRNGREMPDLDAGPVPPAPTGGGRSGVRVARGEATPQPRQGLFGRMFGKGRSAPSEDESEAAPRRGLFRSRSDRESNIYPPTHKKGAKKESELLDPDDLEPIPSGSTSRNPTTNRRAPLAAPRSAREGATRREPISLQPAERDTDSFEQPASPPARQAAPRKLLPNVVPPAPVDPDGFFSESRDSVDRESLDLPGEDTDVDFESRSAPPSRLAPEQDDEALILDEAESETSDDAEHETAAEAASDDEPDLADTRAPAQEAVAEPATEL